MNWFVALNGQVKRVGRGAELWGVGKSEEWRARYAIQLAEKIAEHDARHPHPWEAVSQHVQDVVGSGDTPEEAIRDFEGRMKLP